MSVRIVCIDPNAVETAPRIIALTGQVAVLGDEVEVEDANLAAALLEQDEVWSRPTTDAAKAAKKEVPSRAKVARAARASEPENAEVATTSEEQ